MPARALPRARSGGVQNKCEVKKLAWWKTPTAASRGLSEPINLTMSFKEIYV